MAERISDRPGLKEIFPSDPDRAAVLTFCEKVLEVGSEVVRVDAVLGLEDIVPKIIVRHRLS